MTRYLVTRCAKCNEATEAVKVHSTSEASLGTAVQSAAKGGHRISVEEEVTLGNCDCLPPETAGKPDSGLPAASGEDTEVGPPFRWTSKKLLYVTALVAILLVVFRNPVSHLFGVKNWQLVNSPWLFYRWLFFGIAMPAIPKGPPAGVDLFLFAVNTVLAVLVGVYVLRTSLMLIRWGWKKVPE